MMITNKSLEHLKREKAKAESRGRFKLVEDIQQLIDMATKHKQKAEREA